MLALKTKELITHSIEKVGIKACVTGEGAMLRVHFKSPPPTNYRQSFLNEDEKKALKIVLIHASVRADDLAALPLKALMDRNPQCDFSKVDDVILGSANQAGEDNRNIARMATLLAGLPVEVPATTINRLCGLGLNAIGIAMQAIKIIAGGSESMTSAPFVIGEADNNYDRAQEMFDTTMGWRFVNKKLDEVYGTETMPKTA